MFKETPYDASLFEDVLKTKDVYERVNKIINGDEPMIFPKAYSWVPDDYDFTRRKTNESKRA